MKIFVGEAKPNILFATTTNPKLRKLYRMTMDDTKKAIRTFDMIHGKNEVMVKERRKFLDELDISYADIDN